MTRVNVTWTADEILDAIHSTFSHPPMTYSFIRAELEPGRVLVVFQQWEYPGQDLGVYYSLTTLPVGPMTGEVRESPQVWAGEIGIDLAELCNTGGLDRAERLPGPNGVTLLRWWTAGDIAR